MFHTSTFGRKIASHLFDLKPQCDYICHDDSVDAIQLFREWDWGDRWEDALMAPFIRYLYGAKSLKIPSAWKQVLPHRI